MKKLTYSFCLTCSLLAFQACDNSKTYAEMLEEEKVPSKHLSKTVALSLFLKVNSMRKIRQRM